MNRFTSTLAGLGLLSLLALAVSSCARAEHEASAAPTSIDRTQFTPPPRHGQRVGSATVLNTVSVRHIFSDPAVPDQFVLQLRGPQVVSGQLLFCIISGKGDTLRQEVLPARLLLDDPTLRDNASASVRDQQVSILRGMNHFFAPGCFVQPAVAAAATQPAGLDAQAWNGLRNDPAAVGFNYPSNEGSERRLAFSRRLSKVVELTEQPTARL